MDRRKFLSGVAGNFLAAPFAALAQPTRVPIRHENVLSKQALSTLATNTARNLGPYTSAESGGPWITDYSSITYDPVGRRMCLFGGGHGPSQETDIRIFDLATQAWQSLYAPTPRAEMTLTNSDSQLGRWITTNQPYARHTYNMTFVLERRFYVMTPLGMPDHLDGPGPAWGGRVCWYDFDARTWAYSQIGFAQIPWYFAAAAVIDPLSRNIIVAGPNNQAGRGGLWLYDVANDAITVGPQLDVGYSHDLVYFPPTDTFYVMQGDGRVWALKIDRDNLTNSTISPLTVTGSPPVPSSVCGFAYDSDNKIIGGSVANGVFYAFDPTSNAWTATTMFTEAGSAGIPNQVFYCLDFDPNSGCFIFLDDPLSGMTWAYRYKGTAAPPLGTADVSDLAVTLDFGAGTVATFSGSNVVDKGDFIGEFVRQKCYLAINSLVPDWRVYFRVDADMDGNRIASPTTGWRDEIVVEYGRSTHGTPVHIFGSYVATITKAGTAVATYEVPTHWWYSRWRYQSSQRPVVRSPTTLINRGWLPNFGPNGLFGLPANTNVIPWEGPMSAPRDPVLGAFHTYMADAGDNPQIGHLTEYGADYVINRSAASLATLRTEGEWCGNWAMHIRDDTTGEILDVKGNALRYKSNGGTINDTPYVDAAKYQNYVVVETEHFYPCSNLPWLLTDDPFFLEELQFSVNWQLLWAQYHRQAQGLSGMVYPGTTRAYAWGLRDLFQLTASCPPKVPSWLQPKSKWQLCVDDNKTFSHRYADSPARVHSLFRSWTRADHGVSGWQIAWLNTVVGIAVGQGFTDWMPLFEWCIDAQIKQTNGTSGWSRQWPVPYVYLPFKWYDTNSSDLYYSDTNKDSVTCTSWADMWNYYISGSGGHTDGTGHAIDTAGWDGHTIMQQFYQSSSYFLHLRAALAVAVSRGIAGAQGCYDWLQTELTNTTMPFYNVKGQARFSIDPDNNYQGMWWNAPADSESGWGINFAHQGDTIFATWFTYDLTGKNWWLAMSARNTGGSTFAGALFQTKGPAFDAVPFDPSLVTGTIVGTGTLTFADINNGSFAYTVNGISQTKPITRQVFGPLPICAFGTQPDVAVATNYQGLWWAAPASSESGWGINFTHQGDIIFATWLTYDRDHTPMWLLVTANKTSAGIYSGTLLRTSGPAFNAMPFNSANVTETPVGSATFTFLDGNSATFAYTAYGVSQIKLITREVFMIPGTVCR